MSQHENSAPTATDPAARLPATLRLGAVHLTVSDLDRSIAFYEGSIGLRLHRRARSFGTSPSLTPRRALGTPSSLLRATTS
jgi:catechol-2,3-dioxygenase